MEFTGERMIPEYNNEDIIYSEHLSRYYFATQFVAGKDVLDIACGSGYGTNLMASYHPKSIYGVDVAEESILYAKNKYNNDNRICFQVGNATQLSFKNDLFDLVVSFETLEHLKDYSLFLDEIDRVLNADGILVISTPNRDIYPPGNKFHFKEFNEEEFISLLSLRFKNIRLFYQSSFFLNSLFPEVETIPNNYNVLIDDIRAECMYLIAVCSNSDLPSDIKTPNLISNPNEICSRQVLSERESHIELLKAEVEHHKRIIIDKLNVIDERESHIEILKKEAEHYKCIANDKIEELNQKEVALQSLKEEAEVNLVERNKILKDKDQLLEIYYQKVAKIKELDACLKDFDLLKIQFVEKERDLDVLNVKLEEQNNLIVALRGEQKELLKTKDHLIAVDKERLVRINELTEYLKDFELINLKLNEKKQKLDVLKVKLEEQNNLIVTLQEEQKELLKTKSHLISFDRERLAKINELTLLLDEFNRLKNGLVAKEADLNLLNNELKEKVELVNSKQEYCVNLENQLSGLNNDYLRLQKDLIDIRRSISWVITAPLRFLGSILLNPFRFLKPVVDDFRLGLELLKREGIGQFIRRSFWYLRGKRLNENIAACKHEKELAKMLTLADSKKRAFKLPVYTQPLVSIIIPVFNQWGYTYWCIKSILDKTSDITYEIIVADDASTDQTRKIHEIIKGVNVVRNKENLGFIRNCNHAAQRAKGKYILFLNNDTVVHSNWLSSLVEAMENDEKIGIVGSKLVFPDERLQEAGGIIWNDASGWNYGKFDDPEKPEYNYLREVDYISGASLMIRTEIWNNLKGFDELYLPAYCEDSDIAFRVREAGFKVVYQPKSVVTHFEGVSNGQDENDSTQIKSFQVENNRKFALRWKDVLEKEHFPNGVNVINARDRKHYAKTMIVIDHYVPTFDQDAGSRTVYHFIKFFVAHNYKVILIGDNFFHSEPYTSHFENMGVEVWVGCWIAQNWKNEIQKYSEAIDYVLLSRPHISCKYVDFFRQNTNAKILYYGHDLHQLRLSREFELTKDENIKKELLTYTELENSIFRKVDAIFYPSQIEIDYIKNQVKTLNARAIPAYIYSEQENFEYNPVLRNSLFFIGGFNHLPNKDAMLWFLNDIFPAVIKHNKDMMLYVAGSMIPDEIKAFESENVVIKGQVSDAELVELYSSARIVVVPLRYGAGIKGKIVEAIHFNVPVITTSIGAEGIPDIDKVAIIEDLPSDFANQIVKLYDDFDKLQEMSLNCKELISEHFSEKALYERLKDVMEL